MADSEQFEGEEMAVAPEGHASVATREPASDDEPNQGEPADQPGVEDLPPQEQADIRAAEAQYAAEQGMEEDDGGEDDSLAKAAYNLDRAQDWSARCDLYRKSPQEHKGVQIGGFIRRFEHPFDIADIQNWARKHRGGGTFEMLLYDGRGVIRRRKTFPCEGRVILPDEVPEEEAKKEAAAAAGANEEVAKLREEMARRDFNHQLELQRAESARQAREMNEKFERLLAKISEKPEAPPEPKEKLSDLAAAFGPIVMGFLDSQTKRADAAAKEAREDRKWMAEQQAKSEERMQTLLTALRPKQESRADVIKGVSEFKKLAGGESDPAKVYQTLMKESLPILLSTMSKIQLHKAGVTEGDDEEFGMKYVADRVTELASAFISRPKGGYGAEVPPAQQQGGHPQVQVPTAPTPPGIPQQPGQPQQPQGDPTQVTHAPPPSAEAAPDINAEIFGIGLQYMNEGKPGSHLAHDIMAEEEKIQKANPNAPHKYLAPRIVSYICNTDPEVVLAILNPHIEARPQYAQLLDPIGQEFLKDFCLYFSAPNEDDEDEDEDEDEDGGEEVEVPPVPSGAPAGADDITGGLGPEEGQPNG